LAFLARGIREILEDALQLLQENTNITRLSPGGKARAILDAVSQLLDETYQEFDINLARSFISGATGQFLDLFGVLLGEPRLVSEAAIVDEEMQVVRFYVESGNFGNINGGSDISIPRGTIISSRPDNGGVTYRLASSILAESTQSSKWASVEATSPGAGSNVGREVLEYHNFTEYTDSTSGTLLVTNNYPIANGKDFETDANYRYRLINKITDAEAANETSLRLAALSVPGVADVVMERYYRGIGTIGMLIQSTTPVASDYLIESVESRIEKAQGFSSVILVKKQIEVGFAMKTRIWYKKQLSDEELDDIETIVEDTITDFVNDLNLGDSLLTSRMMSSLFNISDNIANFGSTTRLIDESWVYIPTELEDNRISQKLIGDYSPGEDERIIIEPTLSTPIILERKFGLRPTD
jgi:uncharacterized phage protein gp47/JayE